MNKILEKVKKWLLDDSKSYVVKETYLKKPRLALLGASYLLAMVILLVLATELIDYSKLVAPLALLDPITKFFIETETFEPRNILGWPYMIVVFLVMLIILIVLMLALLLPGLYMLHQGLYKITDMEWPDDPEKTQKWRDNHAKK